MYSPSIATCGQYCDDPSKLHQLPLQQLIARNQFPPNTTIFPLMSTAVDGRRRPNLWSYISFNSLPRRRSISLPTKSPRDPYEKADRHLDFPEGRGSLADAWMNQSSRSRYLRLGGLVAFVVFIIFLLSPGERTRVKQFVGSKAFVQPTFD